MKYNERLYNISKDIIQNNEIEGITKKNKNLLKKVEEIFIEKIEEYKLSDEYDRKGIFRIEFESEFFCDSEKGYDEILKLIKSGDFSELASDYGLYISEMNLEANEWSEAFIVLTFNAKKYYDAALLNKENTLVKKEKL